MIFFLNLKFAVFALMVMSSNAEVFDKTGFDAPKIALPEIPGKLQRNAPSTPQTSASQRSASGTPQRTPSGMPQNSAPGIPQSNAPSIPQSNAPGIPQSSNRSTPQIIFPDMPAPTTRNDFPGAKNSGQREAIRFAVNELNKITSFPYKEKVTEVIEVNEELADGNVYTLKLRLAQSHCKKNDTLCDPYLDSPKKEENKTEESGPTYLLPNNFHVAPIFAPLEAPLTPGSQIRVKGRIPLNSEHFVVNIQRGSRVIPITAPLSMSVTFQAYGNAMEIRHNFNDAWQDTDVYRRGRDPQHIFAPGQSIDIVITCQPDKFELSNNGTVFATYKHRMGYEEADHLTILGMLEVTEVVGAQIPRLKLITPTKANSYSVPVKLPVKPGRRFLIRGIIPKDARRFDINLQNKATEVERLARILHLSYRMFKPQYYIAYNVFWFDWYKEEDFFYMPWFKPGQPLLIEITCKPTEFHVRYNGIWEMKFPYQLPIEAIGYINVDKNFIIHGIEDIHEDEPSSTGTNTEVTATPETRICTMTVWSRTWKPDIWLNDLDCLGNATTKNTIIRPRRIFEALVKRT